MKNLCIFIFFVFFLALFSCEPVNDDFPILKGPYLGQKMPGEIPEFFAPGILTTRYHEHSAPAISPDGEWIFWSAFLAPLQSGAPQVILYSRVKNGKWTLPEVAPFSGQYSDGGPCFSTDGQKIFFSSSRPINGKGEPKDLDIWFVQKTQEGWSEPINLGFPVNSEKDESQPSITQDGNLYFISEHPDYEYNLCISRASLKNDRYESPVRLEEPINIKGLYSWCPCISPDERFLLFTSERDDCLGFGDIYISFRRTDDSWTEPKNLAGPVCSKNDDRFPGLSPDGKVLFFSSRRIFFGTYYEHP